MRTTMNLPDGLLEEIRTRAAASGRTTTSIVVEALRLLLAQQQETVAERPALPAWGEPGGRFLVHPADREALAAALDEE
jgi:plasmid stability protein